MGCVELDGLCFVSGQAQIFDGLEEDDFSFGNDSLVQRKSVKKLVIKNHNSGGSVSSGNHPSHNEDLSESQRFSEPQRFNEEPRRISSGE